MEPPTIPSAESLPRKSRPAAPLEPFATVDDPRDVRRISHRLDEIPLLVADNPAMGRREDRGLGRLLVVPHCRYVISCRIEGGTVEIRCVFHPRQDR